MDQKQLSRFLNSRHATWRANLEIWEKIYCAYRGGKEFKSSFLWRYEREEHEDWQNRLERAAYENILLDIIKRRESLLFSRKIYRANDGDQNGILNRINRNMDRLGSSRSEFIKKCFRLSQVFGFLPVVVDKKSEETLTLADQIQQELYPYAIPVLPFNFLNWSLDEDGKLEWVLVRNTISHNSSPLDVPVSIVEYRLITRERIDTWHEITAEVRVALGLGRKNKTEYVQVAENHHNLGIVPVVILNDLSSEEDVLVGRPSLLDPCELSIQLFNQTSWYDQLLYKTNYSTLAATPFNGSSEEPEIIVGAGDVFWVPEGGEMPRWISPDTAPAEVFERKLNNLRRRIYEQAELDAGLQHDSLRDLSGEAYGHRTKPVEDMARRLGNNLEVFENNLDTVMMKYWEGDTNFVSRIVYPKRYGVRAIRDALIELKAVEESNSLPRKVKSILASKIVFTEGFAELSDEEQDQLEQTIRDYDPLESEVKRMLLTEQAKRSAITSDDAVNGVDEL